MTVPLGSSIIAISFVRVSAEYSGWAMPSVDEIITAPGSDVSSRVIPSLTSKLEAPTTQCAAVRTAVLLMREPPQKELSSIMTAACHGN